MKKNFLFVILGVSVFVVFMLALTVVAREGTTTEVVHVNSGGTATGVVYVKSGGTGDGNSEVTPMGDLISAINTLPDDGGTVVLCGDFSFSTSETVNYTWTPKNGKITVTGKYNSKDYAPTLYFDSVITGKFIFDCASEIEFDNLTFNYISGGSVEFWSGPSLVMGSNVKFYNNGNIITAGDNNKNGVFCFRMGNYNVNCANSNLEIYNGTISYIQAGNNKANNIVGSSTVMIHPNVTIADFVQCGGVNNGRTTNSNVTIDGAKVDYIYVGGYGTTVTGNVTLSVKNTAVKAIYGQRTSVFQGEGVGGTITGDLTVMLDNFTASIWNLGGLMVNNTQALTVKNATNMIIRNNLSGWDKLTLENAQIFISGVTYAGPTTVTADANSIIWVDKDAHITLPDINGVNVAYRDAIHIHDMTYTSAKKPGLYVAGNKAYYHCSGCNKYYAEEAGNTLLDYDEDIYLTPSGVEGYTHHDYVEGSNFALTTIFSEGESQGIAVYGDLLFKASNRGTCTVFDLTSGQQVGAFDFGSVTSSSSGASANHCNSIMFGYQKFDESDPFPLLYICSGNSGGHISEGSIWGDDTVGSYYSHCTVERIKYNKENDTYSSEIVQRIFFNDIENIPVVAGDDLNANKLSTMRDSMTGAFYYKSGNGYNESTNYQKVGWGWPAWFVDSNPTSDTYGKMFLYSSRYRTMSGYETEARNFYGLASDWNYFLSNGTGNAYIVTEVNMPELPTSVDDPNYGSNVILYPKDITDQFTTLFNVGATQGGTMYQGRIYYSHGFGVGEADKFSRNFLQVFDIAKKKLVGQVPLYKDPITRTFEPECPAIWRGELILSMNPGVYFLNYVAIDDPAVKESTCTVGGMTYIECSLCGYNLKTLRTEDELNHIHTNYVTNNDATCTEDGTKSAICDRDGCSVLDTIPDVGSKLGHKFTDYKTDGNATYTEDGTKTAVCDRDGCDEKDTVTDIGSKLEQRVTSIEVTTKPTKLTYLEGDFFDTTGMVVTAYYNNNTSAIVTDYTVSGYTSTPGTKTIIVTYDGKTADFTITVEMIGNWKQNSVGWWYQYSDGTYPANCWEKINNQWYYFNASGYRVTGWLLLGTDYYYLDSNGVRVANRWVGNYYLKDTGIMAKNEIVDDIYVGSDGAKFTGWMLKPEGYYYYREGVKVTGWVSSGSTWYYMNPETGIMLANEWLNDTYYMTAGGGMATGWLYLDGVYYYFNNSGAKVTNCWVGNYYLDEEGHMATNTWVDNGRYYVGASGAYVSTSGWFWLDGEYYYLSGGLKQTGWICEGSTWYYMDPETGVMLANEWLNDTYYMTASGAMATGWQLIKGVWYYFVQSGAKVTGWKQIGGNWYYFLENGAMASNQWVGSYYIGSDGIWVA